MTNQTAPDTNMSDLLGDPPPAKPTKAKKAKANGTTNGTGTEATQEERKVGNEARKAAKKPSKAKVEKAEGAAPAAKADKAKAKAADKPDKADKPAKADKGKAKGKPKADKPAATTRRGERTGEYSAAVEVAITKIKAMKTGTHATTRELAEKYDLKPWAFLAAAHRLNGEQCKLKNANRINTVTRI